MVLTWVAVAERPIHCSRPKSNRDHQDTESRPRRVPARTRPRAGARDTRPPSSVRAGMSEEQPHPQRADEGRARFGEEQDAAGAEDTMELARGAVRVGEVVKRLVAEDHVDRRCRRGRGPGHAQAERTRHRHRSASGEARSIAAGSGSTPTSSRGRNSRSSRGNARPVPQPTSRMVGYTRERSPRRRSRSASATWMTCRRHACVERSQVPNRVSGIHCFARVPLSSVPRISTGGDGRRLDAAAGAVATLSWGAMVRRRGTIAAGHLLVV